MRMPSNTPSPYSSPWSYTDTIARLLGTSSPFTQISGRSPLGWLGLPAAVIADGVCCAGLERGGCAWPPPRGLGVVASLGGGVRLVAALIMGALLRPGGWVRVILAEGRCRLGRLGINWRGWRGGGRLGAGVAGAHADHDAAELPEGRGDHRRQDHD